MRDRSTNRLVPLGTYATKAEAELAWQAAVVDQARGGWVDPRRGRVHVAAYADQWLDTHPRLAPRTRELYRWLLDHHIVPQLGKASVGDLTPAAIRGGTRR